MAQKVIGDVNKGSRDIVVKGDIDLNFDELYLAKGTLTQTLVLTNAEYGSLGTTPATVLILISDVANTFYLGKA